MPTSRKRRRIGASVATPFLLLILLFLANRAAVASEGDWDPHWRGCVGHCQHTGCAPIITFTHSCHPALACLPDHSVPRHLRATGWTCLDDCKCARSLAAPLYMPSLPMRTQAQMLFLLSCFNQLTVSALPVTAPRRYQCMVETERVRRLHGKRPQKYTGRWPFQRVLGAQEAASVLFSLLNLAAHVACLLRFRRALKNSSSAPPQGQAADGSQAAAAPLPRYPYGWLWTAYGVCHVAAWVSSAAFHTRDTKTTERLDYCCAIAVVYVGLAAALVRTLALSAPRHAAAALLAVGGGLAWHLHHMLYVKFDYGWNVKVRAYRFVCSWAPSSGLVHAPTFVGGPRRQPLQVCVGVSVAAALLWLVWLARASGHPGRGTLLAFLLAAHAALLLEVLDFPPVFILHWPEEVCCVGGPKRAIVCAQQQQQAQHSKLRLAQCPLRAVVGVAPAVHASSRGHAGHPVVGAGDGRGPGGRARLLARCHRAADGALLRLPRARRARGEPEVAV